MPADFFSDPNDQTVISGPVIVQTSRRLKKAGSLSTDDGLFTSDGNGNLSYASIKGQPASAQQTIASSGTIAVNAGAVRCTNAGAVTGVILAAGTTDGQEVTVYNEAANSITFAAVATSHVADGTSDVIATLTAARYKWNANASTPAWYRCV